VKYAVSLKATEATLSSGQPLVRGSTIELSPADREDAFNARLIAEGQLIGVANADKSREEAATTLSKLDENPGKAETNTSTEGGAAQ
jgi:hypothetical protein